MDAIEKKFIAQLDTPVASVQRMVLSQVQTHHANTGRTWRGMVAECEVLEETVAQQTADIAALSKHNARLQAANEMWRKTYASWEAVAKQLRRLRECIAFNRGRVIAGAAALAMGAVALNFYGPGTGPAAVAAREATEREFRSWAGGWSWQEGETEPQVYSIQRRNWWVVAVGDVVRDSHADQYGKEVEMHCTHLYARAAVFDFGAYLKPAARNSLMGLFSWPEVATDCKVAATRKAEK
jgi:hypothetical protein